ncbi:MAG: PIN domain-containing protein [Acidobacteriota bacterium]
MKFWDASAVVPLVVVEAETSRCRSLLAEDTEMVVWLLTPLEVTSALTRRLRHSTLKLGDFRKAKQQLSLLEGAWSEVASVETVRERARRLLESHSLRAADALQLAAAIIVSEDRPLHIPFITLDNRLAWAAEREGFTLLGI